MTNLTDPIFTDEEAARLHLEAIRWPDRVFCPFCGTSDQVKALGGKSMGPGWYHCGECRKKFTVRVGSIFERSHVPLHKWVLAFHLMAASKKGMSAHQLGRMLGVTYKTAWFMEHRIRESMREENPGPLGGEGQTVEADETYIGKRKLLQCDFFARSCSMFELTMARKLSDASPAWRDTFRRPLVYPPPEDHPLFR